MLLKFSVALAFAFVAAALAPQIARADIVAQQSGNLSLGTHWSPSESSNGTDFRWVASGAEIFIHHPGKTYVVVDIRLEAGPGLGTTEFPFVIKDSNNRQVAGTFVRGDETVSVVLPTQPNADNRFTLSVIGGGHKVPSDKRILNFRVFSISDGVTKASASQTPSIGASGIDIGGHGWYPVESFAGKTFRWVDDDAGFTVNWGSDQSVKLRVISEVGPGIGSRGYDLDLQDGDGKELGKVRVTGEGVASFDVSLHSGPNRFRLHANGGGKPAPNDKRKLNFRVFAISVVQ